MKDWIVKLANGDQAGAAELWRLYHERLTRLAAKRLSGVNQQAIDEHDVVNSAFKSFFRAIDEDRASNLSSEDEIWRLLVTITVRKAIKVIRYEGRAKRNQELVDLDTQAINEIVDPKVNPEFATAIAEEFREVSDRLVDNDMRIVAYRKMEGYTNAEISQELGCSVRTVKRRLTLIRSLLKDIADEHEE